MTVAAAVRSADNINWPGAARTAPAVAHKEKTS